MASRAYKPGEYFRRSVVAKSSEQSLKQSEDNGVDISKKDIDDHEPVVNKSTVESHSTWRDMEEGSPGEKSKKSQGKRKAFFTTALCDQDSAKISLGDKWVSFVHASFVTLQHCTRRLPVVPFTVVGIFLLGDTTARTHSTEKPQPKRQAQGKLNLPPKYFACLPFWLFCTWRPRSCLPRCQIQ